MYDISAVNQHIFGVDLIVYYFIQIVIFYHDYYNQIITASVID